MRIALQIDQLLRLANDVQELRDALREAEAALAQCAGLSTHVLTAGRPTRDTVRTRWTDELILAEIIARQENGEPLNAAAMPAAVRGSARRRFGGWRGALEIVGINYDAVSRARPRWTRAELVAELRARDARGEQSLPETLGIICRRLYGSVANARRAAGLVFVDRRLKWTKERLVEELEIRSRERRSIGDLHQAAIRVFGSVAAAREAVGVPARRPRKWSRDLVVREVQAANEERRTLSAGLVDACRRYFGSVAEARRAAGVEIKHEWTRERVVAELRASWDSGASSTTKLLNAAHRLFGSLDAAREAAGLPIKEKPRHWTKQQLLDALRGCWRTRQVDDKRARYLCQRYFGSVNAAREAAGVPVRQRSWTKQMVIAELRANWRNRGVDDDAVSRACDRYFGGVVAARRAAGLPVYRAGSLRGFGARPSRGNRPRR